MSVQRRQLGPACHPRGMSIHISIRMSISMALRMSMHMSTHVSLHRRPLRLCVPSLRHATNARCTSPTDAPSDPARLCTCLHTRLNRCLHTHLRADPCTGLYTRVHTAIANTAMSFRVHRPVCRHVHRHLYGPVHRYVRRHDLDM